VADLHHWCTSDEGEDTVRHGREDDHASGL
jgi:hypothetical protein